MTIRATNLKTKKIYSVLDLNNAVKGILNREFPDTIWIRGEIQDYNKNKYRQHIFFELCEKAPEIDQIIAKVTAVIFENKKERIIELLKKAENGFELQDGIEVKLLCKINFYSQRGSFNLIVESIDPVYTLGKLAQNRQRTIAELRAKGLLDRNKKLSFPEVPLKIGLITAYDSAAFNDFVEGLKRSQYAFKIFCFNSFMQGKNVEADICAALNYFNKCNDLDAIVITRGGGSTADLSWFDNAKIAQRIALSQIPVLSGIGHEINITITDMASHTSKKTPTAIAQFLVNKVEEFLKKIDEKNTEIIFLAQEILQTHKQRLELVVTNMELKTHKFLGSHKENLASLTNEIQIESNNFIRNSKTKIKHYETRIKDLDPINIIRRGFSITKTDKGETVRSIKDISKDDEVITIVSDGEIGSKVNFIRKE